MTDLSKPWQGSPPTAFKPKKPFIPRLGRSNKPDHVIGPTALLQGRFEFRGLLRVEGRFEGVLRPVEGANIIVARSGTIVSDVDGCHSVMVEGTIIGSVNATVVDLRRHARIEGNVCCKDLAAATTAIFRNKAAVTPAVSSSSSSSQNHRPSSSASSDLVGGDGVNGLGRTIRNSSSSSSSKAAAANGAANTSPGSSDHRTSASTPPLPFSSAATTVHLSASNGSLGGAADAAPANYVVDGSGAVGECPFPGHVAGKAFPPEGSTAAASSSASRSLYSKKDNDDVAPDSRGGSGGGGSGGHGHGASQESPASSLSFLLNSANNASTAPETPPPPPSRRGSRASISDVGSAYTNAAMESPPRTHRRSMTPDPRTMPTAVPAVNDPSGVARGNGRRLVTGRWGGCPLPGDIQRAMEQEQRQAGLDNVALAAPGGGGGDGVGGTANGQKDSWRGCAKDYGVKTASLTRAFASVAMLLRFDNYTGFEEHLQTEYAAENVWFWKQGMHFRSSTYDSPQKRREEARRIYDAFLSVDAPDQVNISHEDRETVLAALEVRPGAQAVGAGLFDEALIQVENMLVLGPFPRFAGNMVKNIQTSWKKVVEGYGIEETGESFYSVLFEIAPPIESLFTRSKQVQGQMLTSMVDSAVQLLNKLEELVPVLIQLGLRHNAYKVRAEHFPVVENALIATLGLVLQKDFTEEIKQSWTAAYKLMANIMISVLDPPKDETVAVESMVETSSISCSSREESPVTPPRKGNGGAGLGGTGAGGEGSGNVAAMETSSIKPINSNHGYRRTSLRSASGGSSGAGSFRGMYRRGTTSFRNQFSKLVRKESSTAQSSTALGLPASSPTSAAAAAAESQSWPSVAAATAATTAATSVSSSLSSSTAEATGSRVRGGGGTSGSREDPGSNTGVANLVATASLGAATSKTMGQLQAATAAAAAAVAAAARGAGSADVGSGEALSSAGPRKPTAVRDKEIGARKDGGTTGVADAGGAPWG